MCTYKILLVDDIFINRILLSEIVTEMGSSYFQAKNGKEALEILQNEKEIDVVLMDIEMPVMNGFETTKYIRNELPHPLNKIPVIAITAHDPATFLEEYDAIGFNTLISKPYSIEKIEAAIKEVL